MSLRLTPALLLALCVACQPPSPVSPPATSPPPEYPWARATLGRLSLAEKAGQMIGVRAPPARHARGSLELAAQVRTLGAGCVVVFEADVESLPDVLDGLQRTARLPLLVAGDLERGVSFRIRKGVVPLPYAMAVGATRSEAAARFAGEVTAREARALGIHWAFAPVADVNSNPTNPIINIRSYGEDPELVARLGAAFVAGARDGGLITTAKHFPGHGDTAADSHLRLATVHAPRDRLEAVELRPFRRAIAAGVDAVMLGHIAVPALDASGAPATLSAAMVGGLLRDALGFDGLVVTDAMDMAGARRARGAWSGEAAVGAVEAGADLILLPPDPAAAARALVRAVEQGRLPEARLDASVLRLLQVKERLGLHRHRLVAREGIGGSLARPDDLERALDVARRSITVVRNQGDVLPLRAESRLRLLHLVLSSDARNDAIQGIPEEELERRRVPARTRALGPDVSDAESAAILSQAREFTHVLASGFVRVTGAKGSVAMSPSHARLLRALHAAGNRVILVSYGSPYLLGQVPELPVYVCAYGPAESSQRAAVAALFGEYAVDGRLPVTLPGLHTYGHGLSMPKRDMTLRSSEPEAVGFRREGLSALDRLLDGFVERKAFPGGVVAVGKDRALVHLRPFGRLSYEDDAPAVQADTVYDLASLTKVVVTTSVAMILVDEGRLDLQQPVVQVLPRFAGAGRDSVTVWHLLTHSSGLDWWAPLYKERAGKAAFLDAVLRAELVYEPGTRSVYSDLGVILLGEVLERVAGESIENVARERLFEPLGLSDTGYRPGPSLRSRVAPTEHDPWRGRLLRGEVHDENAYALGGVAPHAGLFGTAADLARFAQMLLDGGVYDHRRIVSRATLDRFTRVAGVPGSSRALGWDTPSEGSSAGRLFSPRSFGHTGFTGTSLWIDPDRGLFVVLLTNRVHPTRDNQLIREVRPAVADAVVRALAEP